MKEYFVNKRPKTGLKGIKLLHDNAPCHRASVVTDFLKEEKVKILPHPPSSPDLAPCDFFLFPRLKNLGDVMVQDMPLGLECISV